MFPKRIRDTSFVLGAPENWDNVEQPLGKCVGLPVRVEDHAGLTFMVSEWEPTPQELKLLNAGANVVLMISAPTHPVVSLSVSDEIKEI